tara:strand:+ start:1759 stop:1920 length:162 start_codon:yes stop_codon:yes gene_type:complete
MKQASRYLTTQQVAKELGVHVKTIRLWAKSGKIKEIDLGYRTKRYDIQDLIIQ